MPTSLRHKVTAGFAAALIVMGVIGVLSYRSTLSLLSTVDEQTAAQEIMTALEQVRANLNAAEGAHRGYMITGDSAHSPRYREAVAQTNAAMNVVVDYTTHHTGGRASIERLRVMVDDRLAKFESRLKLYHERGLGAVAPLIKGDPEDKAIAAQVAQIESDLRGQLEEHGRAAANFARISLSVTLLGSLLALIFLTFARLIIGSEIAQRQRTYEQLGEREERLNDLIESASELIQLITPAGRITGANRAWLETLHYKQSDLKNIDIMDVVHPETAETWREAVTRALAGERVQDLKVDFRTREGNVVHLTGSLSCRFDSDNNPSVLRAILRDVTRTLRAESEMREQAHRSIQYLEAMPMGVFVVNAQGSTVYANQTAQEILGRGIQPDASPDMLAEVYQAYCAGQDKLYPAERMPVVRALRGERSSVEDMEIQRRDDRIPLQVTAAPVFASDGKVTGAIAAFTDISERRAVEQLKDELISVVSHELRTPLTSIRGALGLVGSGRLGTLSDQGRKMIDIAVTDTDRLVRLINDMLDIERIQSGRIEMHKTACDAADLVRQSVDAVMPLADKAGVKIETNVTALPLNCDSDRIIQTLTNLLGNAIKFSPAGSAVLLAVRQKDGEAEFRVVDQGRGIPREKLETIFERFQQVDASDARDKGGAGLGLAISRSIVVHHGGRIWVESDGEHGSTFLFTLPVTTASSASEPNAGQSLLLVVEDDPSAAEVLRTMLETHGYSVALAGNGAEALDMARRLQPAAILLDILMPVMNGWEAMGELKTDSLTMDIPIIVLSGLTADLRHDDARVSAWIGKPYSEMQLVGALRSAFGMRAEAKVMIVEDDDHLAEVLSAQFEASGLRCMVARNGADAIRIIQQNSPDLLVLDLMLPERDGFEVVDWLRQHEQLRHLPLVVYTALELNDAQKEELTLGPSEFLTKTREDPASVARLVSRLLHRVSGGSEEES